MQESKATATRFGSAPTRWEQPSRSKPGRREAKCARTMSVPRGLRSSEISLESGRSALVLSTEARLSELDLPLARRGARINQLARASVSDEAWDRNSGRCCEAT